MNRQDGAVELLEGMSTRIREAGWVSNAGGDYENPAHPLCLLNTMFAVLMHNNGLYEATKTDGIDAEAINVMEKVIADDHPCECAGFKSIAHFNDLHCDGAEGALDIITATIKAIRDGQG